MANTETSRRRVWIAASICLFAVATWVACKITPEPEASPKAGVTLDLPSSVGAFTGTAEDVTPAEKSILPPDTRFAKMIYADAGPAKVNCQIVLSGNDRRSIHRPEACLRGQGWTIENGGVVPIKLDDGKPLDVMELVIDQPLELANGEKKTIRSLYLYWFVSEETTTPYHSVRLARTYTDLLLHNITNRWAYVIVSAPVLKGLVRGGKDEAETLDMLKNFIAEAAPKFQRVGEGVDIPTGDRPEKASASL